MTKRRTLSQPQIREKILLEIKPMKNPPKIPRSCGLFSLAAWAPSVPTGSSRWPTTVDVLMSASRRRPVPPLDRALFSLGTSTARRRSKLFSLAEHDRRWPSATAALYYFTRPFFSRLSASSSRLPGPPGIAAAAAPKSSSNRVEPASSSSSNPCSVSFSFRFRACGGGGWL